jgi:hypothetical protein
MNLTEQTLLPQNLHHHCRHNLKLRFLHYYLVTVRLKECFLYHPHHHKHHPRQSRRLIQQKDYRHPRRRQQM